MEVSLKLEADFIDWKEIFEKLNEVAKESSKNIRVLDISYRNGEE